METNLSIEQLANLKIAIEKSKAELSEVNKELKDAKSLNEHLKSENARLAEEIKQQVEIKENLIKENERIRAEKDIINSEFAKKTEEIYKDIREKQEENNRNLELIQARLIECERRERNIARKMEEQKMMLNEINQAKKSLRNERLTVEQMYKDIEKERNNINQERAKLHEQEVATLTAINENNKLLVAIREEQQKQRAKYNQTSNKLLEISAKEKYINELMPKIEKFKDLLIEIKNFTIENGKAPENAEESIKEMEEAIKKLETNDFKESNENEKNTNKKSK